MGMYSHVNFEMECPRCQFLVRGFQTKQGGMSLHLSEIQDIHNFYCNCSHCGLWIELERPYLAKVTEGSPPKTIKDAKLLGFNLLPARVPYNART
jgi:hypothetical protein